MKFFADWKFVLMFLVTIAGVVVPVWLWQADLNSKSLSIRLVTRVSLQPKEQEALPGMEISVDGSNLVNPYLVVLEVKNDGNKPILQSDFESPIDIRLDSDTSFSRSRITNKTPKDIDTDISAEKKRISLKPALLNPKDSIAITVITSGVAPIFATKARIVGIPSVSIEDSTIEKPAKIKRVLMITASVLLLIASMITYNGAIDSKGVFLRQRAAVFVSLVSAFPGVVAFMESLEGLGIQGYWRSVLSLLIMIIPIGFLASALNRKPSIQDQGAGGK